MKDLFRDLTVGEALVLNEACLAASEEVEWGDSKQKQ